MVSYTTPNITLAIGRDYLGQYKEDKLTILSPTPLEKVGDIADRIVCKDGVWGVEKNIKTDILNRGNSVWSFHRENDLNISFILENMKDNFRIIDNNTMTNYPKRRWDDSIATFGWWSNEPTSRGFSLPKSLGNLNSNPHSMLEWLDTNELFVKYPTTQPQFIPLPHDQQVKLRTFANRTNISFLTEIEPTLKAQVPKSLGATVNTHTTQIDNLNKELDRVKKLEESTVSTVTSDKAFTTIAETSNGYFEDVKIEGKTLVNLADIQPTVKETCTTWYKDHTLCETSKLKLNEPYTMVVYCNYLSGHSSSYNYFEFGGGNHINSFISTITTSLQYNRIDMMASGIYTKCLEFVDFKGMPYLACRPCRRSSSPVEGEMANYDISVLLLEGDHTDKDISYFEGLKSVGQDGDRIEILSRSKNLLDESFYKVNSYYTSDNTSANESTKSYVYSKVIKLKPKTEYTLTHLGGIEVPPNKYYRFGIADYNKKEENVYCMPFSLNNTSSTDVAISTKTSNTFTTNESGLVCIRCYNNSSLKELLDNSMNKFVLLEGTETSNVYLKSELNKKEILYFNPTTQTWEKPVLREWDSIEKHSDGKYYYHKRSEEVVLNGSESWYTGEVSNDNFSMFKMVNTPSKNSKSIYMCDKFNYSYFNGLESIYNNFNNYYNLEVFISKAKAQDVQGFKQWLQANNVTVVYQLAQEEVYECTNLDLITYNGETNLIVSSGAIQPKLELKVLSNVSNVVKLLQEKVSILENKFIKGLQQVLAGDMMSLAHLLYPEDFALENDTPQVIPYIEEGDINE